MLQLCSSVFIRMSSQKTKKDTKKHVIKTAEKKQENKTNIEKALLLGQLYTIPIRLIFLRLF